MIEIPTKPNLLAAPGSPFIHRDLSWVQFNDRVLAEAIDPENPLLERLKFLAISASNLDEFFAIRLASLSRSISALVRQRAPSTKIDQLKSIRVSLLDEIQTLQQKQGKTLLQISKELKSFGLEIARLPTTDRELHSVAEELFKVHVVPQLQIPQLFKTRDFSAMGNLQVAAVFPNQHWMTIPKTIPATFVRPVGSEKRYALFTLDDLLIQFLPAQFGIAGPVGLIRLTRDGDFSVDLEEEDTESIPDIVRSGIGRRDKGRPVRLQTSGSLPESFVKTLANLFKLEQSQVFLTGSSSLFLHGIWSGSGQFPSEKTQDPRLRLPSSPPSIPKIAETPRKIFERLRQEDILLHHPYDSFDVFIAWLQEACRDTSVTHIDLTVYRTDAVSPIITALKKAATTKTIRVVIELRARFDELNNLRLAEELRSAGVQVFFGFGKLKVHAKIALVTRNEEGQPRRYTHLSTGNYNAITARQYTDLAILTAHPGIGADAQVFFDCVTSGRVPSTFKTLLSAPTRMHRKIHSLIEAEMKTALEGKPARIVAKVNALVDESIIQSLYRASNAGVKIDLIVRGACSLIPGVPGLSKNIRVISIVDRYLEHSRIYYFESAGMMYLSSADWMPRNFFSRLEIAFPVLDPQIFAYLKDVGLPTYLGDTVKAHELTAKGTWKTPSPAPGQSPIRSQFQFRELAKKAYKGTPLE